MSLKVETWDIEGGKDHLVVAVVESIQVTGGHVRDEDDNTLLIFDLEQEDWVDRGGRHWLDWTVSCE